MSLNSVCSYGRPGVQFSAQHRDDLSVTRVCFLPDQVWLTVYILQIYISVPIFSSPGKSVNQLLESTWILNWFLKVLGCHYQCRCQCQEYINVANNSNHRVAVCEGVIRQENQSCRHSNISGITQGLNVPLQCVLHVLQLLADMSVYYNVTVTLSWCQVLHTWYSCWMCIF